MLVFIATYIAFAPAIRGDFLQWDDDVLLLNNPDYRGLGAAQIRWMFSTTLLGNYMPITWLSYAIDYAIVGMRPVGYHITNNLLHAFDAAMVFGLARLLLGIARPGARPDRIVSGAFVAAMLFAIHPLRVESVAWITERKDVLSAFFLIPSVYAYVRFARESRPAWYVCSLVLLALSLLAKAWGITIPAVLLVLDWFPLARWKRGSRVALLVEKLPYVAVCGAMAGIALWAQTREVASLSGATPLDRIAQTFYGLTFYVSKMLLPVNLSPIYEHPTPMNAFAAPFVAAVAGVIGVVAGLWMIHRTQVGRSLAAALATYAILLLPVLGIVQVGPQLVADRYSYVACIPIAVLAGGGVSIVADRLSAVGRAMFASLVLLWLAALGVATWRQCDAWRNSWSLWQQALKVDPQSWTANNGAGALYMQFGDFRRAVDHLKRAAERRPDHAGIAINLGGALARSGQNKESTEQFRRAAAMPGATGVDLLLIGNGFEALGLRSDARDSYRRAVDLDPKDAEARYRLATILLADGDRASARQQFVRAVELLEPSIERGQRDAGVYVDAAMFGSACDALVRLFESDGDATAARKYREKQALLKGR